MQPPERILQYRESPLAFVKDVWGLEPQPLKPNVDPELDESEYNPSMFKQFVKGYHLTWHQWLVFRSVEWAMKDWGSRWISIVSGHGTGKSAAMAMLQLWFLFCWENCKIGCTAPSGEQLYDVLWSETSLWLHNMKSEAVADEYEWLTSYVRMKANPEGWFSRARTARQDKPEALAGLHADNLMLMADEASGIHESIFKTAHGALTNPNTLVLLISNGTRNVGYFYDSHHHDSEDFQTMSFDSRESPIVDEKFVDKIRRKYGEGSDEWRIRVEGKFPDEEGMDDDQYKQLLTESDIRQIGIVPFVGHKRMGVDPSGMGNNKTVVVVRDGFKAKVVYEAKKSTPEKIAGTVVLLSKRYGIPPTAIYMDIFGVGADAYQKLAVRGFDVNGVECGAKPEEDERFLNRRAEAYWRTRAWLRGGGELIKHEGWSDLKSVRYKRMTRDKIQMMPKEIMVKKGFKSPDFADALMLTFIEEDYAMPNQVTMGREGGGTMGRVDRGRRPPKLG